MTTMQRGTRSGIRPARLALLGLLAAGAVTLSGVAAPLAGTAHAGGLAGGVVGSRAATTDVSLTGSKPGISAGNGGGIVANGDAASADVDLAGSKPGLRAGLGN